MKNVDKFPEEEREPWCTCGAKTPQWQRHKAGCIFRQRRGKLPTNPAPPIVTKEYFDEPY